MTVSRSCASTLFVSLLVLSATAQAQSLSHNTHIGSTSLPVYHVNAPLAAVSITQSSDASTITPLNSVSCNNGIGHTDNHYYRAFTLNTFPALDQPQFAVQSVTFGIESATSGTGAPGQPVTVNVYKSTTNPPTNASLSGGLQDTVSFTLPDMSASTFTANLPNSPVFTIATDILVVEIFTPNGEATSHLFFIGSNTAAETGAGYIEAADCGITDISSLSTIGFPNMHIVMTVSGQTQGQQPVRLQDFNVD